MSQYPQCPTCGHRAQGGLFGGAFVPLHKCQSKGHIFCNACKNGDRCPLCTSDRVRWNYDKAFPAD